MLTGSIFLHHKKPTGKFYFRKLTRNFNQTFPGNGILSPLETMEGFTMAKHDVYQFYAELDDYSPKIWRRFEINGEKTMAELAYTVMIMFEMEGSHLYSLEHHRKDDVMETLQRDFPDDKIQNIFANKKFNPAFADVLYEMPNEDDIYLGQTEKVVDPTTVKLKNANVNIGAKLTLSYDFGDDWLVNLVLEDCKEHEISLSLLPRVLDGEGHGIVEDVGGTFGLERLAKTLADKNSEDYETMTEWLGTTDLDLEKFNLKATNSSLKKLLRYYSSNYEED